MPIYLKYNEITGKLKNLLDLIKGAMSMAQMRFS